MEPYQLTTREALLWVMLINAVIGFGLGLIPLLFGYFNKKLRLGLIGIAVATVGGAILGIFISIPATIIFTWLVARKTGGPAAPEDEGPASPGGDFLLPQAPRRTGRPSTKTRQRVSAASRRREGISGP